MLRITHLKLLHLILYLLSSLRASKEGVANWTMLPLLLLEELVAGVLLVVELGSILTLPIPIKLCAAHRIVILDS
jgi:hypothetical protein